MKQVLCPRQHLYHVADGEDAPCPVCASLDAEIEPTRGVYLPAADAATGPVPGAGAPTIGAYAHLGAPVEPVVGWLACVDGPDKGRDWRLTSGRNGIGRGEQMPVRLALDGAVSRERHAVVSFDPRHARFTLAPGDGQGLVYLNGQELLMPQPLAPHDRIELGASTLVFVPLVGERFRWDE